MPAFLLRNLIMVYNNTFHTGTVTDISIVLFILFIYHKDICLLGRLKHFFEVSYINFVKLSNMFRFANTHQ